MAFHSLICKIIYVISGEVIHALENATANIEPLLYFINCKHTFKIFLFFFPHVLSFLALRYCHLILNNSCLVASESHQHQESLLSELRIRASPPQNR